MACAEPRLTALKIAHKGEIHRLRIDLQSFHFVDLQALVAETFMLAPAAFVVQYSDHEGDLLNVTSEAEYIEACRVFLSTADAVKSLRFTAVPRSQIAFQENVAEPILKAIEKLVETLKATMEKVKQEQWSQRAEQTGEVLNRAATDARESLVHTGEVLTRASFVARESLTAAGKTIQEIPFDKVLKETGDNLKLAAENIGSFANELVEEMNKLPVVPWSPVVPMTPADVAVEPTQSVAPTEAEWEQVDEQTTAPSVEEAPVVVVAEPEIVEVAVALVVSVEEQKWATQIAMIHDIIPGVDARQLIDRLEQCNGNVEVVVNALMEEM